MDESQYQNTNRVARTVDAYTTESALRYRLDTAPLKFEIRLFLEGRDEGYEKDNSGMLMPVFPTMGKPLANAMGVQRIMSSLTFHLNSAVVQGNISELQYEFFLMRTRQDLATHLMNNLYDYEISETSYEWIIDNVMNTIELFVSRAINDLERRSYQGWMVQSENVQMGSNKKMGVMDNIKKAFGSA